MLLHGSAEHREEFDALMTDSALAAIDQDAPLMQIEAALRSLGEMIAKADPLRRAIVREETIRRLRGAGVRSAAAMAATVFGPLESAGLDRIRQSASRSGHHSPCSVSTASNCLAEHGVKSASPSSLSRDAQLRDTTDGICFRTGRSRSSI